MAENAPITTRIDPKAREAIEKAAVARRTTPAQVARVLLEDAAKALAASGPREGGKHAGENCLMIMATWLARLHQRWLWLHRKEEVTRSNRVGCARKDSNLNPPDS